MSVSLFAVQVNMTTKCQGNYVGFSVGSSSEYKHKMSNEIMLASLLVVEVNMATKCRVKSVGVSVGCSSEQEHKMSSNIIIIIITLI